MALDPDTKAWLDKLLDKFSEDNTKVSDWENNFLKDQVERVEQYGDEVRMSSKQFEILDRVAEKYNIGRRPRVERGGEW